MRGFDPLLSIAISPPPDTVSAVDRRTSVRGCVKRWLDQCRSHDLKAELIFIDWNPPAGGPRLAETLAARRGSPDCALRVIEVPGRLHQHLPWAGRRACFPLRALNVGI